MTWQVRNVTTADADAWLRMRLALWPAEPAEHRADIDRFFAGDRHEPREVLVVEDEERRPVGFAELSIRNIVDGCDTPFVGYLEGWYVEPAVRRRGAGRALVEGAERWAQSLGCTEFASDVLIENTVSLAAHRVLGFEETSRVCTFRKSIAPSRDHRGPEFTANDEIAIHVPDPTAAEAFYTAVLGCTVVNRTADCVSLRSGALRIYLVRDPERAHDAVVPSFDVPDRRAALARLAEAGCTLVPVGPHAPGDVYVRDPHGVVFDVVERRR
jgi:aminoglycoside 6'-N-acetyltransferase I